LLTKAKVEKLSRTAYLIADDYKTRWSEYRLDAERERRIKAQTCKTCWYILRPRQVASIPSKGNCAQCGTVISSNKAFVNLLCDKCAKDYDLCKECGAYMNYIPKDEF